MAEPPSPTQGLRPALIANIAAHLLAMAAMALLLMPSMPGGTTADPALRMQLIADQPWRFRLGWLPWQLTAVLDLWLAVALLRARAIPRRPAWIVLILTLAAVIPDQLGQALWVTRGVELAQAGDLAAYLAYERPVFELTAGWGALLYSLAALGWTACFKGAGLLSRGLERLAWPLWGLMITVSVATLAVEPTPLVSRLISTGNGVGFALMMVWLVGVTRAVGRPPAQSPASEVRA